MTFLPTIETDKANHDFYGSTIQCITLLILLLAQTLTAIPVTLFYYSIIPAVILAIAKEEIWDRRMHKGMPNRLDTAFTILGALKVYVPAALLVYLLVT